MSQDETMTVLGINVNAVLASLCPELSKDHGGDNAFAWLLDQLHAARRFQANVAAIPLEREVIHGDGQITQRLSSGHLDVLILEARAAQPALSAPSTNNHDRIDADELPLRTLQQMCCDGEGR